MAEGVEQHSFWFGHTKTLSGIAVKTLATIIILGMLVAPGAALAQDDHAGASDRIDVILEREYDYKLISSGQNFPPFNVRRQHRGDILLLLAARVPLPEIRDYFGWSADEIHDRLAELQEADLVKQMAEDDYRAAVMVMSLDNVTQYVTVSESIIDETLGLIDRYLPEVVRRYSTIQGFQNTSFESSSLLILSNVLLDNWQIRTVEREFLKAERPLRAGSRYYYSIQENSRRDSTEAFGIYGNQYRGYGQFTVGIYGNRRTHNELSFINLGADGIEELFKVRPDSVRHFKESVLEAVVEAARDSSLRVPEQYAAGLDSLGWTRDGQIVIPVLNEEDESALDALAGLVAPDLLALFERHRSDIDRAYRESPYAAEVSFEEYFMWWFHLFYTAVTDRLIDQGHIHKSASGITTYVLAPR